MRHIVTPPASLDIGRIRIMNSFFTNLQAGHAQLGQLIALRAIATFAQCIVLAWVHFILELTLSWMPMLICISLLVLFNLFSWIRLRTDSPVSNLELFAQLCVDVTALTLLLYYAGGSTNPFVSLYLLPLVIAAASLPQRYTWSMAIFTTVCYTALMKYYQPLPSSVAGHEHMQHAMQQDDAFNIHVIGMWLGFVISALVVAYFVVKMANAVRDRDEKLARAREQTLRNERIVALGMQAASAAHELGTPLATLKVVIGELRHETNTLPEWNDSLLLLEGQVRNCKRILDKLLANAQDANPRSAESLEQFIIDTLDEWQLLRPTVRPRRITTGIQPAPNMLIDSSLRAALLNLLNNAADVSPDNIEIQIHWDDKFFNLEIKDFGDRKSVV